MLLMFLEHSDINAKHSDINAKHSDINAKHSDINAKFALTIRILKST
jgi:hypothetical protein